MGVDPQKKAHGTRSSLTLTLIEYVGRRMGVDPQKKAHGTRSSLHSLISGFPLPSP